MNQHEITWLRKIIFLTVAIPTVVSLMISVRPAFAQIAPSNFDGVDVCIGSKTKELGIPGAALVIV